MPQSNDDVLWPGYDKITNTVVSIMVPLLADHYKMPCNTVYAVQYFEYHQQWTGWELLQYSPCVVTILVSCGLSCPCNIYGHLQFPFAADAYQEFSHSWYTLAICAWEKLCAVTTSTIEYPYLPGPTIISWLNGVKSIPCPNLYVI